MMLAPESSPTLPTFARRPAESLVDVLESQTQIIRRLWALEPKAPKSRVRWVLLLGILVVAGVLALDASVREVARTKLVAARARIAEIQSAQPPAPIAEENAPATEVTPARATEAAVSAPILTRPAEPATATATAEVAPAPAPRTTAVRARAKRAPRRR